MKIFVTALLLSALSAPAHAIRAIAVKKDKVLLDLEDEAIQVGERLGARDDDGKARALLEVKQVKNNRALATVIRGAMREDYSLEKLSRSSRSSEGASSPGKSKSAAGFTAGYAMNSMNVKPAGASSVTLNGSSFNLSGFYQMALDGNISARILGGYETLNASGAASTAVCTSSTNCTVDLSYLGVEALVRYSFIRNRTIDISLGLGLGFLFALNKSSNVLDTTKISTNQTVVGALGIDYQLGRGSFIPLQLDYAVYPDNNTSSASQIIFRAGYGFNF